MFIVSCVGSGFCGEMVTLSNESYSVGVCVCVFLNMFDLWNSTKSESSRQCDCWTTEGSKM